MRWIEAIDVIFVLQADERVAELYVTRTINIKHAWGIHHFSVQPGAVKLVHSVTSLDAPEVHASSDVREPISLHQRTVHNSPTVSTCGVSSVLRCVCGKLHGYKNLCPVSVLHACRTNLN